MGFFSPSDFSASTVFLSSFETVLYSSRNFPSPRYHKFVFDAEMSIRPLMESEKKLEIQDLLARSLHKIWLLNHRKKANLNDCTSSVSTYKL